MKLILCIVINLNRYNKEDLSKCEVSNNNPVPGPGSYSYEFKSNSLVDKNKMSSFKSNVPKLGYLNEKYEEKLLGPGQYGLLNEFKVRKSFHLNARKRFVS